MAENSHISWTDHTFNPWMGCTKVSPACTNCYAEVDSPVRQSRSIGLELWGPKAKRRVNSEQSWNMPLRWNRQAEKEGRRFRVFCASLADVFEDNPNCQVVNHKDELMYVRPSSDIIHGNWWTTEARTGEQPLRLYDMRRRLFFLIDKTPHLDWLLLTKRPENVMNMVRECGRYAEVFWPNVWMGTTVENQKYAEERIPHLLKIPARVRFLSIEPMVGPVELTMLKAGQYEWRDVLEGQHIGSSFQQSCPKINWVITGGESGTHARPAHPDWYRSLRNQCQAADVPFFMKQLGTVWAKEIGCKHTKGGDISEFPVDLAIQEFPA